MTANDIRIVLCTCPDQETAGQLASGLVKGRLAACVNLLPGLTSVYRWQGRVQHDPEVLLLAKTRADRLDALTEWLSQAHPYELPEIIAVPVVAGLKGYLDWVAGETADDDIDANLDSDR